MKNQIVASIAALPFALGTVFAGAANAYVEGGFQLSGTPLFELDFSTAGNTTATLSGNSLSFVPDTSGIALASQTGSFIPFDLAQIQDIKSFQPFEAENPFIDLGSFALGGPFTTNPSISDGVNVFNLASANFSVNEGGPNTVSVDVMLFGEFNLEGKTVDGEGILTLQISDTPLTAAQIESQLEDGIIFEGLALSGAVFTVSTPEPTALFGLGVVATGLVASRRKKNS